jgi:hypothetical protein
LKAPDINLRNQLKETDRKGRFQGVCRKFVMLVRNQISRRLSNGGGGDLERDKFRTGAHGDESFLRVKKGKKETGNVSSSVEVSL